MSHSVTADAFGQQSLRIPENEAIHLSDPQSTNENASIIAANLVSDFACLITRHDCGIRLLAVETIILHTEIIGGYGNHIFEAEGVIDVTLFNSLHPQSVSGSTQHLKSCPRGHLE